MKIIFGGKRVSIYKQHRIYTNPILTEKIINLEEKYPKKDYVDKYRNSVNFSQNNDVPFHQWFRYREGFSGALIKDLIKSSKLESKDAIIIDPFSGSGTTPVVAAQEGYYGIGVDVNPVSVFISNVKLKEYDKNKIKKIYDELRKFSTTENEYKKSLHYEDIKKYFNENNFYRLLEIKQYIDQIKEKDTHDFFLCAFLSILEASSDRRRDGNGLKKAYSKISNIKEEFTNKVYQMLSDIEVERNSKLLGEVYYGSALELYSIYRKNGHFQDNNEVSIIFSPPYANSFDYFESYKLELVFGDFAESIKDIKKFRSKAVRSFVGVSVQDPFENIIDMLCEEIEKAILRKEAETGKKDSRTRRVPNMIRGYFYDMKKVIEECNKCLQVGNKTYIVVDQSSYIGIIVPTDILFAMFAEQAGFEVTNVIKCRNARTSSQQSKKFPYLKEGLRESIIELTKLRDV